MIIVVSGQARKAGKTLAVCDIISGASHLRWLALKITPHAHPMDSATDPDTDRYLRAGAAESRLISDSSVPLRVPVETHLIIESNAILQRIQPDLIVFVRDTSNPEWKPSATGLLARADFVVDRRIQPEMMQAIQNRISALQLQDPPYSRDLQPEC